MCDHAPFKPRPPRGHAPAAQSTPPAGPAPLPAPRPLPAAPLRPLSIPAPPPRSPHAAVPSRRPLLPLPPLPPLPPRTRPRRRRTSLTEGGAAAAHRSANRSAGCWPRPSARPRPSLPPPPLRSAVCWTRGGRAGWERDRRSGAKAKQEGLRAAIGWVTRIGRRVRRSQRAAAKAAPIPHPGAMGAGRGEDGSGMG